MNPGYFFLIACWMIVIMIMTAWLDRLWPDSRDIEKSRKKAVIFIICLISLQGFFIPISSKILLNLGSVVLLGLAWLYFFITDQSGLRLQMLCVILFLGIFYGVAYEMMMLDPILMVVPPQYLLPAFLVLFLLLTTTQLYLQWIMLAGGFILGDIVHKSFMFKHVDKIFIGDAIFRDHLMMGFIMMTVATLFLDSVKRLYQYTIRILISLRKQEG